MSAGLLVTPRGEPAPPSAVVEALARIDPALSLRWVTLPRPYWAIVEHWAPDHPKRALVRSGETPADLAFDMVAMLPSDCSPEEAVGFVERTVRPTRGTGDGAALVAKMREVRAAEQAAQRQTVLTEAREEAERTTAHDLALELGRATANAQVTVATDLGTPKRKHRRSV